MRLKDVFAADCLRGCGLDVKANMAEGHMAAKYYTRV